jgi:branched-subunit amino acid aminotransferase/4-amino-4-deoxychorismate lyase
MRTMMIIQQLTEKQIFDRLNAPSKPYSEIYYAFYSSWFGGILKNPMLMLLPIDDHMVHRGDGVFEAMKAINRSVYLMDEHLKRLFISADKIALACPFTIDEVKEIILETLRAANQEEVMIRVFLSRGPGSFSVNPYDSSQAQLYVVITELSTPSPEKYEHGVVIGQSDIPCKSSLMAQIKSCNYLPNVLMKKEAVDRKLDFVIGIDEQGNFTESATENMMIVDKNGVIVHPPLDTILKGTTMIRACELAREIGMTTAIGSISIEDMRSAREVIIVGTSLNVLPVIKFENFSIGHEVPGPIAKKLNQLMLLDISQGKRGVSF